MEALLLFFLFAAEKDAWDAQERAMVTSRISAETESSRSDREEFLRLQQENNQLRQQMVLLNQDFQAYQERRAEILRFLEKMKDAEQSCPFLQRIKHCMYNDDARSS